MDEIKIHGNSWKNRYYSRENFKKYIFNSSANSLLGFVSSKSVKKFGK